MAAGTSAACTSRDRPAPERRRPLSDPPAGRRRSRQTVPDPDVSGAPRTGKLPVRGVLRSAFCVSPAKGRAAGRAVGPRAGAAKRPGSSEPARRVRTDSRDPPACGTDWPNPGGRRYTSANGAAAFASARLAGESKERNQVFAEEPTSPRQPPSSHATAPERAVLVGFPPTLEHEDTLDELALLADTAGAVVTGRLHQRRVSVHPGNFLSRGKLEEAGCLARETEASLLVCDEDLSPAQVRNLEKALDLRVIDRSELILDIFARRARTREAKLQVELAQLRYLLPRLTGMWGHLSRTGGGIGTRGPGETQLEVDRRRVRQRISMLERQLATVEVERRTQSKRRADAFRAALVGYTNAGKSTLFNRLTRSSVLEEDKLFATLDTTTRRLALPGFGNLLLSDTVGFLRKLPHHLIVSFRATLREVETANLLLHVVDVAHPARNEQIAAVDEVLEELLEHPIPRLLVLNKADLLEEQGELEARARFPEGVLVSALRPEDRDRLIQCVADRVREMRVRVRVECPAERYRELVQIARRGERRSEAFLDGRVWSEWWVDRIELDRLRGTGFRVEVLDPATVEDASR